MVSKVSIYYDSYSNNSRILINNEELSPYSSLLQYMTEPIYRWAPYLFDKLYRTVEDDYMIEFTGRTEEHELVKFFALQDPHCKNIFLREFPISVPLQERMKILNNFIKQNRTLLFEKKRTTIHFYLPMSLGSLRSELEEISVNNRYCKTNIVCDILQDLDTIYHDPEEIGIAIARDWEQMNQFAEIVRSQKYFSVIGFDRTEAFSGNNNSSFLFKTTKDGLFDTIFKVLLLFPLQEVYNNSCRKIAELNPQKEIQLRMRALRETQPILTIGLPDSIESGTSKRIAIKSNPETEKLPELIYECHPKGIVKIDGSYLRGLKAGEANIRVFRKGELKPIHEGDIRVYDRNRITSLTLNMDEGLTAVGEAIQLERSFFPENADNVAEIHWKSEDPDVARVSPQGQVVGVKPGTCKIYCIAEKVKTQCIITVKPRLREILLPDEILETRELEMVLGEEYPLEIQILPGDAIDAHLIYYSEDTMVANIVRGVITAVGPGTTRIKVQNNSRRVTEEFQVVVNKQFFGRDKKKKKRFLFF